MWHRKRWRRLGRKTKHKWALLRNLVTSLVEHERIITTTAKAKEMRKLAENIITYAKKPDRLHGSRLAGAILQTEQATTKLMRVLGPRYALRDGGYTRIMKLAQPRRGDRSDMSIIEYVDRPGEIRAARPPQRLRALVGLDNWMARLGLDDKDASSALAMKGKKKIVGKESNFYYEKLVEDAPTK